MNREQERVANKKAAKWELLAGVFGWCGIFANLAFLYFVMVALFFAGGWINVGLCFLVAGVARWLMRGFEDHKKRVYFEAKLLAAGMTEDEAGAEWMNAYSSTK